MINIVVSNDDFDAGAEIAELSRQGGGAVASFVGLVRGDDGVVSLELEHYPLMTEKMLRTIADQAMTKWNLRGATIHHRVGRLEVGEQIVLVCTLSDHRHAAFESCNFIMDHLKTDAPFWKKQRYQDGSSRWIEERQSDLMARHGWKKK